ncbi:hypothetical protein [Roseateles sp. BYS87W]|uniref:Uncharacterized protein n=1 Tax=Pelomonas baiyunensis TaxID=3299026 RepID=A0ABW7GZX9_9BURK
MSADALQQEWLALQSQHEPYEAWALAVKLAGVAVALWAPSIGLAVGALALLWLQEGVLKTFQARLGARLLAVEAGLRSGAPAMQLHSDWLAQRPRGLGLVREYLRSAMRPTVALPYPLLMGLVLLG